MNKKSKSQKKYNPLLFPCIILFFTSVTAIIIAIVSSSKKSDNQVVEKEVSVNVSDNKINTYTDEEIIKIMESASENAAAKATDEFKEDLKAAVSVQNYNVAEYLRTTFSDKIVYLTDNGFAFRDISPNIPRNNYSRDDFVMNEFQSVVYKDSQNTDYKLGIDVSEHQGEIDWHTVATNSDVEYAIIRVGFRGYGESGSMNLDKQFENNIEGALKEGLPVGVYFFSQAVNEDEIKEEIDFTLEAISPYKITYPVIIDVEKLADNKARGNLISKEERTKLVKIFCEEIEKAGYTPMIYGNTYSFFEMLDMEQLYQYQVWFAFYSDYIYYPYTLNMWQFSESFEIPGIKGVVDTNLTIP